MEMRVRERRMMSFPVITLLTGLVVLVWAQPLAASSLDDLNKRLQEIQKSQTKISGELSVVQSKIKGTQENIADLTKKIGELETEVATKETAYNEAVTKVDQAQKRVDAKQVEVDDRQVIIRTRARASYEEGRTSTLGLLLQSESFSDLLSRIEYLKCLDDKDKTLLDDLQTHQIELEGEKTTLTEQMETAKTLKVESEKAKKELEQKKKDLQESLTEYQKNEAELRKSDKELDEESKKIYKDIEELQGQFNKSGANTGNGTVNTWPVPSIQWINSAYRPSHRPNHNGVDVAGPLGTTIVAAGDGIIVKSSRCGHANFCGAYVGVMVRCNGGYGNHVIIDHGNGITTLYGHLKSSYLPTVGSKVTAGQKVGEMGSTGNSSGYHLHFETAKNGVTFNPRTLFPGH